MEQGTWKSDSAVQSQKGDQENMKLESIKWIETDFTSQAGNFKLISGFN